MEVDISFLKMGREVKAIMWVDHGLYNSEKQSLRTVTDLAYQRYNDWS